VPPIPKSFACSTLPVYFILFATLFSPSSLSFL
jgi:hypothetical protein